MKVVLLAGGVGKFDQNITCFQYRGGYFRTFRQLRACDLCDQ